MFILSAKMEARWQFQVTSLKQGIAKIFENKELSDAVFIVQGEPYKVHKLILAAGSNEFARILLDPNVPDKIIVDKDCITKNGFGVLLRYIYTDKIGTEEKKSIVEASLAAQHYRQKALLDECERKIESWTITKDEVCDLLDSGKIIPHLREKCLECIRNNPKDVIALESFLNISLECLNVILDSGVLNDVKVEIRIERIMNWAIKRYGNYELARKEFLKGRPPLIRKLGFENLSLKHFGEAVAKYRKFLDPEEVVSFMVYFNSKEASVLPEWCAPDS